MTEVRAELAGLQPVPSALVGVAADSGQEAHGGATVPELAELGPFTDRLGDTLKTLFLDELPEKGYRSKRIPAFIIGAATQALDRGRAMVLVLPPVFDEVLEHGFENGWNAYQTAGAAGLTIGGIFAAWGTTVGKAFHYSLNSFPKTTETVIKNHPVMVGVVADAIDGFPSKEDLAESNPIKPEGGYDVKPYETRKSRLGKAALALTRGLKTAFLYGSTAHVGMAKVNEHSEESNKARRRVVTAESAVALGSVAVVISSMVTHDFMGAAEQVKDVITNKQILMGASLGFIGISAASNYAARKGYTKKATQKLNEEGFLLTGAEAGEIQ